MRRMPCHASLFSSLLVNGRCVTHGQVKIRTRAWRSGCINFTPRRRARHQPERDSLSARTTDRLAPEDDVAPGPRVAINGASCLLVCVVCLGRVSAGSRALHRVVACRLYLLMHGGPSFALSHPNTETLRGCAGDRSPAFSPVSPLPCCPPRPLFPVSPVPVGPLNPCPLSHPNT